MITNYKDIIKEFDIVLNVTVDNNKLTVQGTKDEKPKDLEVYYKHKGVTDEVVKLVRYVIGVR